MATLREAQKRMTRELLLERGLALFSDKGYHATTIEDIAAAAGTTRTTFYLHFTSKSELLAELLKRIAGEVIGADETKLEDCVASGDPAKLRGWLDRNFDNWEKLRPYMSAAYEAAPTDAVIHQSLIAWFEETITSMQRGLDRSNRYPEPDRRARAVLAFGQFEYTARRYFSLGWRTPREVMLRNMTDSWAHLLTGPDTRSQSST